MRSPSGHAGDSEIWLVAVGVSETLCDIGRLCRLRLTHVEERERSNGMKSENQTKPKQAIKTLLCIIV